MKGKGIFLWNVRQVCNGDPQAIAQLLSDAGIERVEIKAAQAYWTFMPQGVPNVTLELVRVIQDKGIQVYGWSFNTAYDPKGEAEIAIKQIQALELDGWIFDWESAADKTENPQARAKELTERVRQACPDLPLGWCSWPMFRNPKSGGTWHPAAPAWAAMQVCDFGMPMAYWGPLTGITPFPSYGAVNALWWLEQAVSQWRAFTQKPLIPTGRAYSGEGTIAQPDAVRAFGERIRQLNLAGDSWWSLEHTINIPEVWQVICDLPGWAEPSPDPSPVDTTEILERLDAIRHHIEIVESTAGSVVDDLQQINQGLELIETLVANLGSE